MQPMTVIRNWQLDQLRRSPIILGHILETTPPEDTNTFRDGGDGWTVLEVVCHLHDFEALFLERARLTMEKDFPDLPDLDADQAVIDGNYRAQNLDLVYAEWRTRRDALLAFFAERSEEDWERPATHSSRGLFTLHDQLFLTAWHDNNHIDQIVKTLAGRIP